MKQLDPEKTVFLIDGSSFLYRAYYSLRPLHTSKGIAVQAVYSFCRMIKKLIDTFNIQYIAIVWDSKGKTTRHEMYDQYKATRQPPPSDIFDQKEYIVQFADLIGIQQIAQSGIEADDIMYSIAKDNEKRDFVTVFVTLDKDMHQALSDTIIALDPIKNVFVDQQVVFKKREFTVEKLPFYFALLGDASDNIPGVPGVGKKTATDLVKQFDSLEDMYGRLDHVKTGRLQRILTEHKDNAFLSRDLFLLQYHPIDVSKDSMKFDAKNWANARPLFEELEFKSLLKELGITDTDGAQKSLEKKVAYWKQYNFVTVTTQESLNQLHLHLHNKQSFALDTETDGLDSLQANLIGISFCTDDEQAFYIPIAHKTDAPQLSLDLVTSTLQPLLQDATYKKYLHHAKFDLHVLQNHPITLNGVDFDTLLAAKLLTTEDQQRINLKALSQRYLDQDMLSFEEITAHQSYKDFSYIPLELATLYSCTDALQTMRLAQLFKKKLQEKDLVTPYQELELPLIMVLYSMEQKGIMLDATLLATIGSTVDKNLAETESAICSLAGIVPGTINLNSPKQIEQLLFHTLKLPPQKKSSKGTRYSTDHEVLTKLIPLHPIAKQIITYRELAKLKSTYIDALPTYINKKTGRIHSTFSQTIVATGRLSSSDPNLQNIPASYPGIVIREAFKAEENHLFISADYSQIELRVLAYVSQDKSLIDAFAHKRDIHQETACKLFDVAIDQVTHEQRQLGKRINFSILYGLTPYGLSRELNIPFKDAKLYIEKYFHQYPGVSTWMKSVVAHAQQYGYVETAWKRRRYIPNIHEKNKTLYEEAVRVAVNTVAQGTAADIMKKGMINVHNSLLQTDYDAHIMLQIHDELIITADDHSAQAVQKMTKNVLESVVNWNIPLEVKIRSGRNWREITE